ncbi:ComEC/Rec2 family competence protein [Actinoplanes sp. L3-i22]|uniref:ComEC/Rec2 family competence protein n=1 Tax=Actinoplanes sp. L3-i22 TaxID=2836373 RepID=UPI0021046C1F|nr:MBL fold metallo-hydrolase [Actinoplanes sp. L3-i22]
MLPAAHGDALWVEWDGGRMLIDGGPRTTYTAVRDRVRALPVAHRHVDRLVVTHIDADHIEGVVRLLQDWKPLRATVGEVWFNGWRQLEPFAPTLGADQGEMVGAMIRRHSLPANDRAIMVPGRGPLPVLQLPCGARATVLSPGEDQLRKLRSQWVRVLALAGMTPGRQDEVLERLRQRPELRGLDGTLGGERLDSSVANASSIAFLLEHAGRSALFTGDGHSPVLAAGLRRLLAERGLKVLDVDLVKLPHHGSAANVTTELLALIRSPRFLVSTNGAKFKHPDVAAVRRVIDAGRRGPVPTLFFNYRSSTTRRWDKPGNSRYQAVYPASPAGGLTVVV